MENRPETITANQTGQEQNLESRFAHIKGWGVDADPENDPQYPMKKWNGADHLRSHYPRPVQQPLTVEILKSIERKNVSATFGTSVPPSGLSGAIRRFAFKYSEDSYGHWLPLIIADRVNMVEGLFSDLAHGHVPNWFAERGFGAEWKYNKKKFIKKMAIRAAIVAGVVFLCTNQKKSQSKLDKMTAALR